MSPTKRGLMVVNQFISLDKFTQIYSMLSDAAANHGAELEVRTNMQLLCDICCHDRFPENFDFVLFWDKDTRLAGMLEDHGLRLFNSAKAIALCDDKALTYITLMRHGIAQPRTLTAPLTFPSIGYNDLSFVNEAAQSFGLPLVVKESNGSFGAQVHLAHSTEEAAELIRSFGTSDYIIQQFVPSSSGRDIRANVLGDRVVASMLRMSTNGDFRSNLTLGGVSEQCVLTAAQEQAALDACRALGLDFAGVDLLFGENGEPLVCEVNSNPHFKTTLDCTGINMAVHIIEYILRKV